MEALGYLGELKSMGLVVGVDFTWSYQPKQGDYFSAEGMTPPSVSFTFINESLASWAELKWA